jgi:hypothetical protein
MPVRVLTVPAGEPVSIEEQRDFMRVDGNVDDSVIGTLIVAAREQAEFYLRRSLVTRTLRCLMNGFPMQSGSMPTSTGVTGTFSTQYGDYFGRNLVYVKDTILPFNALMDGDRIRLPFPPVQSIQSVNYYDPNGTLQVLAAQNYILDPDEGLIQALPNAVWPPVQWNKQSSVYVDYTAGYGVAFDVPQSLRVWIMRRAADLYENRELVDSPSAYSMLDAYRVFLFN